MFAFNSQMFKWSEKFLNAPRVANLSGKWGENNGKVCKINPGLNCKSRSVLGTSNCKSTSIYQYCARLKTSLQVLQVFTKTWITLAS